MGESANLEQRINGVTDKNVNAKLSEIKNELECLSPETITKLRAIIEAKKGLKKETRQKLEKLLTECNTLPEIAEANPQIYEFLNKNISAKDTPESLKQKLRNRVNYLSSTYVGDDFVGDIKMELLYRESTKKPEGAILGSASTQIQDEITATKSLKTSIEKLTPENISDANDYIIDYYNQVGGNIWGTKELNQWKNDLAKERKTLGYTYDDFTKWRNKRDQLLAKR